MWFNQASYEVLASAHPYFHHQAAAVSRIIPAQHLREREKRTITSSGSLTNEKTPITTFP